MINRYEARFGDGLQACKRAQSHTYSHAWRIRYQSPRGQIDDLIGFSTTRALAEDAVTRHLKTFLPKKHRAGVKVLNHEVVSAVAC